LKTPSQIASDLGIKVPMLRRYAVLYEEYTGQKLPVTARGERLYTTEVLITLQRARSIMESEKLGLEASMRQAVRIVEISEASESAIQESDPLFTPERLQKLFREAIEAEITPLRQELVQLRSENQALQQMVHQLLKAQEEIYRLQISEINLPDNHMKKNQETLSPRQGLRGIFDSLLRGYYNRL
ncbi:hypothetical protein, partial [Deinococcus roseus]|uniref:hypothetical protein n=1 Tax=Deinococcus roseus TaxID=392414 RepID=UPI001668E3D4